LKNVYLEKINCFMLKNIILLFLIILSNFTKIEAQTIYINEFMASNASDIIDNDFKEHSDWIELYNSTNDSIDLSGFFITDNLNEAQKWQIPSQTIIQAHNFLLIYADNEDTVLTSLHTNFKLSRAGESLALFDSNGVLIDSITFGEQLTDISFGRKITNLQEWCYFGLTTPDAANFALCYSDTVRASSVNFSLNGGFFSSPQYVVLSSSDSLDIIKYTTNGSIPSSNSATYNLPIVISQTEVIRARVINVEKLPGKIVTHTYFINENFDLPVFSISTNPSNLYSSDFGIYAEGPNYILGNPETANFGKNWKRPINIEYFDENKLQIINKQAGISISGGMSRLFIQKSFSIYSGAKYENTGFNYQFFDHKSINNFTNLKLRNSGNDFLYTMFRDGMMQTLLIDQMDIDYQSYKPSIVFLNNIFWGIYNLREKHDEYYIVSNYNLGLNEFDMLENLNGVINGTRSHYHSMIAFMGTNNLFLQSNYDYIKTQMDVNEYINYQIAEIYFNNLDWPANNIKYWRPNTSDGKWRWIIFDTDWGFGLAGGDTTNTLDHASTFAGNFPYNPPLATFLFAALLNSNEFKNEFIQRFAAHMNISFDSTRVISIIDSLKSNIESTMPSHISLWENVSGGASIASKQEWNENINIMYEFANNRAANVRQHINDKFSLSTMSQLKINISDSLAGKVLVQDVEIPCFPDSGLYFDSIPLRLVAIPNPGYSFLEWEGISNNDTISIELFIDTSITAVFEHSYSFSNIYINEFLAKNNSDTTDNFGEFEDWIEIYNADSIPINIGGLYITDDFSIPNKWQIPETQPNSTTIQAEDFLILWADNETIQGNNHLNFKLSSTGEQIGLYNITEIDTLIIDTISFSIQFADTSFGRIPDADTNWYFFHNPSPEKSNSLSFENQEISLPADWGIFSTYIKPHQLNLESVFMAIESDIVLIKGQYGKVFYPQYTINQIGNILNTTGYNIKTNSATNLQIVGTRVDVQNTPIFIETGWRFIPYLHSTPAPIANMLSNILTDVEIVKDENGNIFSPQLNINQIGNLYPGKGYQIKMILSNTLIYPSL
jgi:hypothetical protein